MSCWLTATGCWELLGTTTTAVNSGLRREDVALEMPPLLTWFVGRADVTRFFAAAPVFAAPGRLRLVPVRANGQPAFAAYQRQPDGAYRAYAVTVPAVTATGIARIVTFFDPGLFSSFGLPAAIPGEGLR